MSVFKRLVLTIVLCQCMTQIALAASEPMIRDMDTGYLLNCNFRAIRAYMWQEQPPLTGWETDDRGGVWESRPTGLFENNNFAFNVEWFRLHDTSEEHAVTIRHQIARQDSGTLTLESRFAMLDVMDGASWQLQDMTRPAVTLIIHDGNLCYQTADGGFKTLVPVKADAEYGVKVLADIDRKTADIFVNGQRYASGINFLNAVKTLDYVLVKTGDNATGDLYLNPVNIHKGYNLCETFVTSTPGVLPSDWKTDKPGKATTEIIKSASLPDIYSLKLQGAAAGREFEPLGKKIVFEFCFMTPDRTETETRLQTDSTPVLSLVTHNNDLCVVDENNNNIPLVKNYLPNLWYAIKIVVDADQGKAVIDVNGKQVLTDAPCLTRSENINGVRFSMEGSDKLMWVDDIMVYPWRDYPTDYVPKPAPVNQKDDYLIGVPSCSLWKEGDAYAGWDYVYPYADKRKPALGWYDDGSPEVADWEIKWQVEHAIDFEQYCWYRPNDAVGYPIKNGVLEHGIRDGLFNARYSKYKKFTIMYTNQGAGRTNPDDWTRHMIPYWIEYFFKDPRYLKVDGKPVFSIYHLGELLNDFGGEEGATNAITVLREACRDAGFPGIIILMEERARNSGNMKQMKALGIDYCFAYTWHTPDTDLQMAMMTEQQKVAATLDFGVVPSFSVGWQSSPWGGSGDGMLPAKDYKALALWTRETYMPLMPENSLGRKMALSPNWNEFGEGHFIMPSNYEGFGYLDALREVFPGPASHKDEVPNEKQKKRFTVLYPKK